MSPGNLCIRRVPAWSEIAVPGHVLGVEQDFGLLHHVVCDKGESYGLYFD